MTESSNRGFSLTEVMVTIGIMSIVALAILQLQATDQQRLLSNRQMSSRDTIKRLADRYILDSKVILDSATITNYTALGSNIEGNRALDYCLNGPPAAATPLCPAAQWPSCCNVVTDQPFNILDPSDPSHTMLFAGTDAASTPMAATNFTPVRYDINGNICNTPSPDCSLELVATFNAECLPSGSTNCNLADRVLVNYKLRGATGITPTGGTPFKPLGPTSPILVASAAGGGSSVLQLKCAYYTNRSPPPMGTDIPCTTGANVNCLPPSCPTGWTDSLTMSSEITAVNAGGYLGNCIRTCTK